MNVFRCLGLSIIVLLGACDAQETPVPKPKTEASFPVPAPSPSQASASPTVEAPSEPRTAAKPTILDTAQTKAPVNTHELMPGVPVVPVVVGKEKAAPAQPAAAVAGASSSKTATKAPATKSGTAKREAVKGGATAKAGAAKDVRRPRLDLSLPPDLVKEMVPPPNVITAKRKPLLPPMFSSKESSPDPGAFELNGRLLSNEMQLQMRNESRRDVEGAALDFKFKQ